MNKAKIFKNGRSQAVRLPQDFRFDAKEVYIKKISNIVLLIPKSNIWKQFVKNLDKFSLDFMDQRNQPKVQNRKIA